MVLGATGGHPSLQPEMSDRKRKLCAALRASPLTDACIHSAHTSVLLCVLGSVVSVGTPRCIKEPLQLPSAAREVLPGPAQSRGDMVVLNGQIATPVGGQRGGRGKSHGKGALGPGTEAEWFSGRKRKLVLTEGRAFSL